MSDKPSRSLVEGARFGYTYDRALNVHPRIFHQHVTEADQLYLAGPLHKIPDSVHINQPGALDQLMKIFPPPNVHEDT
jgi:hypothetical protein